MGDFISWLCRSGFDPLCELFARSAPDRGDAPAPADSGHPAADVCAPLEHPHPIDLMHPERYGVADKETAPLDLPGGSPLWWASLDVSPGKGMTSLREINRIIHALPREYLAGEEKEAVILTRSAEEILANGTVQGGCHDYAILFAGLARSCGFPVVFVDSADFTYLRQEINGVRGHIFLKVFVDGDADGSGRWLLVDPTRGFAYEAETKPGGCLPGFEVKEDAQGAYLTCDRVEMYEVANLWDVGYGIDPLHQCMRIFRANHNDAEAAQDVVFRPIPL